MTESCRSIGIDLVVIVDAIGLIGAEKGSLRLEQRAARVVNIDSREPSDLAGATVDQYLQADAVMAIGFGCLPREVMLQEGHAIAAPIGAYGQFGVGAETSRKAQVPSR